MENEKASSNPPWATDHPQSLAESSPAPLTFRHDPHGHAHSFLKSWHKAVLAKDRSGQLCAQARASAGRAPEMHLNAKLFPALP